MSTTGSRRWILRRLAPVLMLVLVVFVVSAPSAHAGWFDWVPDAGQLVVEALLALFVGINALLGQLLAKVQSALLWILTLKMTAGVTVVGFAWSVLRDLVNMVFILLFIVISFATIFNVTGVLRQYYWKQALVPLLIGAIVLNYSLAIGQAVSLLSNRIAAIAVGLLPDPGGILIEALKPHTLSIELKNYVGPGQDKITDVTKNLTEAEQAHMTKCLNEEKEVSVGAGTSTGWWSDQKAFWGWDETAKIRKNVGDCNLEIIEARNAVAKQGSGEDLSDSEKAAIESHQAAYATFSGSLDSKTTLLGSAVFNAFMLVLIISCLVTAFVFLLVRILVIWALLALSPLAWMGYALPGKGPFNQWWNTFIAWNMFGPLYVFTLIPGMHILIGQGELLTALARSGAGSAGALVQLLLFQGFALLIFVGGLGIALRSSFAGAVKGTAFAGAALEKFGAFDAAGRGALRQFGRGAGALAGVTGVSADVQATRERLAQQRKDVTTGTRARLGIRTKEETLAQSRAQLGVRGGAEEVESLRAKRIKTEQDTLEARLKQTRAQKIAAGEEFGAAEEQEFLEKYMNSGNPDVALAVRDMLTARGKLEADEMGVTADMYARISPLARQSYVERAATRLTEKAGKKDAEGFKDTSEIQAAIDLIPEKERGKLLGTLEANNPLLAAEMAGDGKNGLFKDPKTKEPLGKFDVIDRNANKLSESDWLKLYEAGDMPKLGEKAQYNWQRKMANPKERDALLRAAKGATRQKLQGEFGTGRTPTSASSAAAPATPASDVGVQRSAEAARIQAERDAAARGGTVRTAAEVQRDLEDARRRGII